MLKQSQCYLSHGLSQKTNMLVVLRNNFCKYGMKATTQPMIGKKYVIIWKAAQALLRS